MSKFFLTLALCVMAKMAVAQTQKVTVLELHQAPGQFVNEMPYSDEDYEQQDVCDDETTNLAMGGLCTLGTYGGYITVKFDHAVENKRGSDFCVWGNGFYAENDPVYGAATIGGSIEPGIVYVGVGDDVKTATWYELAGSEYYTTEIHDFKITYYKPTAESGPFSLQGSSYDNYIRWKASWTDKDGLRRDSTGYHQKNSWHKQTYWPTYEHADSLVFEGGKLPNNAKELTYKDAPYWVQYRYAADAYGYVDASAALDTTYSSFDIDWAVDKQGHHVDLKEINFIRVVCGVFQYCGNLGETSTEIKGFTDLHLLAGYDENPIVITPRTPMGIGSVPRVQSSDDAYYNLMGQRITVPVKGQIYIHQGRKVLYR